MHCNEFENSREGIFSKFVCELDQKIFWLVRIKKEKESSQGQRELGYLKETEDKRTPGLCV